MPIEFACEGMDDIHKGGSLLSTSGVPTNYDSVRIFNQTERHSDLIETRFENLDVDGQVEVFAELGIGVEPQFMGYHFLLAFISFNEGNMNAPLFVPGISSLIFKKEEDNYLAHPQKMNRFFLSTAIDPSSYSGGRLWWEGFPLPEGRAATCCGTDLSCLGIHCRIMSPLGTLRAANAPPALKNS